MSYDAIPLELRLLNQWVVWKSFADPNAPKPRKIPYDPNDPNKPASAGKPETWGTFGQAVDCRACVEGIAGLGFEFHTSDPYAGIDLDHCRDDQAGVIEPWAQEIVDELGGYAEISPSETGVHIIVRAVAREGWRRKSPTDAAHAIEIYDRGRYFCMTGNAIAGVGTDLTQRQDALDRVYARCFPALPISTPARPTRSESRDVLMDRARRYVERIKGAVSGQHGHDATFKVAMVLVEGFALDAGDARTILDEYNTRCAPPWDERELSHKIESALKAVDNGKLGHLADAENPHRPRMSEGNGNDGQPPIVPPTPPIEPPPALDWRDIRLTDDGNARAIVYHFGHLIRYVHRASRYRVWTGKRWQDDVDDRQTQRYAVQCAKMRQEAAVATYPGSTQEDNRKKMFAWGISSESQAKVSAALDALKRQPEISTLLEEWDTDPWLLGLRDGAVDLKTGKVLLADSKRLIARAVGCDYDPTAKCPRTENFLFEIAGGDESLATFIMKAIGYSLTGVTSEQCFFLCHGSGKNGKSTCLNLIHALLGEYGCSTSMETFLEQKNRGESRNDLAALHGSRYVSASETGNYSRLDEGGIKKLTGGDPVQARFLYQDFFTFIPQFKPWIAFNHEPKIVGVDEGIWRRIRKIPFKQQFDPTLEPDLPERLTRELPGLLNLAIHWCLDWQKEHLGWPSAVRDATAEYRQSSDVFGAYLDDCTEQDMMGMVSNKSLYMSFVAWCSANGESKISQRQVAGIMRDKNTKTYKSNGIKYWVGLKILENTPKMTDADEKQLFD